MNVCLIIPPSVFLLDDRVFPSLGVLRVAAALERAGHGVDVLDLSGIANYEDVVREYARGRSGGIYGVTATTPQMPAATKVRAAILQEDPGAHTVLGGPHPTLVLAAAKRGTVRAKTALEQLDWHQVVAGDGERAVVRVVSGDRRRIVDADDPQGPLHIGRADVGEIPEPARHLVDLPSYKYQIDGVPATSLISQLGCPFQCAFCGGRYSAMLRRTRTRTKENIVAEIDRLYRTYGFRGFMFYDDELNINGRALVELMNDLSDLQSRLGVDFRLRGFVKSELFDNDQATAMHRAGFRWILTGFESGDERILKNIRKRATRDDNTRCVETAHAAGLKVKALMSIGHAGESEASCRNTETWLYETRPEDFDVTIITTYPGTPYYDDAVETAPGVWTYTAENGDRLHSLEVDYTRVANYYKGIPGGGYTAYVHTDALSADDLVRIRDEMETSVRSRFGIPWNPAAAAVAYEHSMGQLPTHILRSSQTTHAP